MRVEVFNGSDGGESRGATWERVREKRRKDLMGKNRRYKENLRDPRRGGISLISPSSSDATRNERRNNFPRCKNGGGEGEGGRGGERKRKIQ